MMLKSSYWQLQHGKISFVHGRVRSSQIFWPNLWRWDQVVFLSQQDWHLVTTHSSKSKTSFTTLHNTPTPHLPFGRCESPDTTYAYKNKRQTHSKIKIKNKLQKHIASLHSRALINSTPLQVKVPYKKYTSNDDFLSLHMLTFPPKRWCSDWYLHAKSIPWAFCRRN